MPAPIVLSTLTPETKRVPNPPPGEPVIATKVEFRDGSRGGGTVDPVDPYVPPPAPDPGADTNDWKTILTGTGGGTVDPSFDPDNFLTYVGAFRIGSFTGVETNQIVGTNTLGSMTYKAPDGTNGTNGSVFISGWDGVAEVLVPALSVATDQAQLNSGTVRQNFVNVMSRAPSGNVNGNDRAGWMKIINNKLLMGTYKNYDANGNSEKLLVALDSSDLANSAYRGAFNAWTEDFGGRYVCEIPASWQSTFGHTHFAGVTPEMSIASRSSFGHSLLGIDLDGIGAETTAVSSTVWAHYPQSNPINGYSNTNGAVANYYAAIVWTPDEYSLRDWYGETDARTINWGGIDATSLGAFCALPVAETGRETTLYQLPLPDQSLRKHAVGYEMTCGVALIPPGTNTAAFIGAVRGARYGQGYKHFSLEEGPGDKYLNPNSYPDPGGFDPISLTDKDNFVWTMNLNDVAGRNSVYDPQYSGYTPFVDPGPFNRTNIVVSGHYDTNTNRLYLLSGGHGSSSLQWVVSVYNVGAV